jgi:hypothetical protein
MMDLTEVQKRLLIHMDKFGPKWFSFIELDRVKLLRADDVVTVPSLIEHGLVMHLAVLKAVALTAAGTVIADETRSKEVREIMAKAVRP